MLSVVVTSMFRKPNLGNCCRWLFFFLNVYMGGNTYHSVFSVIEEEEGKMETLTEES